MSRLSCVMLMRNAAVSSVQAYAAGCNIVVLASDFQRVQIIPSAHGDAGVDLQVSCISCCSDDGKVWHASHHSALSSQINLPACTVRYVKTLYLFKFFTSAKEDM